MAGPDCWKLIGITGEHILWIEAPCNQRELLKLVESLSVTFSYLPSIIVNSRGVIVGYIHLGGMN